MFITESLTQKIVKNGLKEEYAGKKEIYSYCINYLLEQLIFIVIVLLFGILTNKILFYTIFYFLFVGFRFTSGGYHAPNQLICTFLSYSTIIVTILLVNTLPDFPPYIWFFLSSTFSLIIARLSPIDNPKKRLDISQREALQQKIWVFINIITLMQLFFCYTNQSEYYKLITVSCFISILSIFGGIYTNYMGRRANNVI